MFKSFLICVIGSACAFAQGEMGPGPAAGIGTDMVYFSVMSPPSAVPGAPYSAQATTERSQILADGNRITQTTTNNVARDSQGRTRNESMLSGISVPGGAAPHLVTINDPVAGCAYTLDSDKKIAFKFPIPPPPPHGGAMARTEVKQFESGVVVQGGPMTKSIGAGPIGGEPGISVFSSFEKFGPESNAAKADLGSQTIEGVLVQGTRLTKTIAAGAIGNEQPIAITTETWYSPDLKVLVMSKSSDPRIGETTYKLANIQRSEPAASLFQVPSDYTLREGPAKDVFFQKGPKDN
jgi:hypothetical protein